MVGRCARLPRHGEVAEWSKAHAWKVCIRQRIEGSNPSFSAKTKKKGLLGPFFLSGNNAALAYGDELASCWKHLAINVALVVSINPNNELSVRWFFPYRNQLKGDNRKDE